MCMNILYMYVYEQIFLMATASAADPKFSKVWGGGGVGGGGGGWKRSAGGGAGMHWSPLTVI